MPHFEREANVTMSGMPTTAREFLAHMATHYKHLMSEFETVLWEAQVFSVYEDPQIVRALKAHMESGTSDANFMPKYGAIRARLEPVRGSRTFTRPWSVAARMLPQNWTTLS